MPATEVTRYPIKRLHRVFAVASLALLAATIWMLVVDHRRPWKRFQRNANEIEIRMARLQKLQLATEASVGEQDDVPSNRAELDRLDDTLIARRSTWFEFSHGIPKPGKKWLELPLLDAFNSPLRVHNLWAEGLTQDYHFRDAPRYDRCTTCHTSIDRVQTSSTSATRYPLQQTLQFTVPLGEAVAFDPRDDASSTEQVQDTVGLRLAAGGLLGENDVSVVFVRRGSPASRATQTSEPNRPISAEEVYQRVMWPRDDRDSAAGLPGLRLGDAVIAIDGQAIDGLQSAIERLKAAASKPGTDGGNEDVTLQISVRRGVPQPYASHPRLDLFVDESSPHKMSEFACTICHDGQGSATDFAWASHSPNSESQRKRWRSEYEWFDNPHWGYPMLPSRFVESACLKCHHRVVDLLPSDRFPDPPAPKLLRGYQLILNYGCFGCHEIEGFRNGRSIGPDLQLESIARNDGVDASSATGNGQNVPQDSIDRASGLRRPGPSLRGVGQKLSADVMADWIRDPRRLRASTRMPRAFGLWNHLDASSRRQAERYEPLEIAGIVAYLQTHSQDIDLTAASVAAAGPIVAGSIAAEAIARGKTLFQTQGCLACHNHKEFPEAAARRDKDEIVAGPDLSGIADKLTGEDGRPWLVSFITEPTRYDSRTIMPAISLKRLEADGDPVEDIVQFLFASSSMGYSADPAPDPDTEVLDQLVVEYLSEAYHVSKAADYAVRGIPRQLADSVRDAERQLLTPEAPVGDSDFRLSTNQKLQYVGQKSIAKYGCFGCHEIAGFESAKPIGPALTGWGRIDPHNLAFGNIVQYLEGRGPESKGASDLKSGDLSDRPVSEVEADSAYYMRQIRSGKRSGFAFQKLREPRSYDYGVVADKRYNERLRMHQFSFSDEDREAIVTFVLGLVAQPPAEKYLYAPDRKRAALIEGSAVLDRYRCGSCHILEPQQWQIAFAPGAFREPVDKPTYSFVPHQFSADVLEASRQVDRSGQLRATLSGMPRLGNHGELMVFDDYGDELFDDEEYDPRSLEYAFQLWEPAVIEGQAYQVGGAALSVWGDQIVGKRPATGGFLAKYLLPHVVQLERRTNPNAVGAQAWAWLPPPLLGEGLKVRPDWLHSYLLEPYPIRPAVFLWMPKYNLSMREAAALVDYFAARDDASFPYEFVNRRSPSYLAEAELAYRERNPGGAEAVYHHHHHDHRRLSAALQIVSDKNYCVTCHIVGDFQPVTSDRAKGPDLAAVYRRLRGDYLRRWIAQPASILPYTPMQVIIPFDPDQEMLGGVPQSLFHGTSEQQLDGVVDLLMNFDRYARQQDGLVAPRDQPIEAAARAND